MTTRRDFLGRCAAALAVLAGLPKLLRADEPTGEFRFSYDGRWINFNGEWRRIVSNNGTTVTVAAEDWRTPQREVRPGVWYSSRHRGFDKVALR